MKLIFAFFIFVLGQVAMGYVQYPQDCLSASGSVCHFGTVKKTSRYTQDHLQVFLGKETLLKRENDQLEWVYGPVLFEVDAKAEVYFKKNKITLQKGKYLFFGREGELKVDVLDGNLRLNKFQVTEGFQCTFSFVAGEVALEPLLAIDLKEHVVRYVHVKNLDRERAGEYMDEFIPKHKNYLAWVEELNQNLINRAIAHDQSVQRRELEAKQRAQAAEAKRKFDFFNKVFDR